MISKIGAVGIVVALNVCVLGIVADLGNAKHLISAISILAAILVPSPLRSKQRKE